MLQWLNVNAGAVQGVSAVVTVILTALLIVVTWRYVRLTNKLARSAQDQFDLGQRQFELACKAAVLPYLPQFNFNLEPNGNDPRNWMYSFSNGGNLPLLVQHAEIQVKSDSKTYHHRLNGLAGRVVPAIRGNEIPNIGRFVIPNEYWVDGLSVIDPQDIGAQITTEVVVSDIGKLFTYRCTFNALVGYIVEPI